MTHQISYEKILEFRTFAERYTAMNSGKFSRFLYALSKMLTRTKKVADELNDKMTYLNLEHAEKDNKGFAVMEKFTVKRGPEEVQDERYRYTAEKSKKLHEAKRELLQQTVDIDCFEPKGDLTEFLPPDMDFHKWHICSPFLLPEEPEEGSLFDKLVAETGKK